MKKATNRFQSDSGAVSLEFLIVISLLFAWLIGSFLMFDAFISYNKANKANATVANLASRLDEVDNDFLGTLFSIYNEIAGADPEQSWMRMSAIQNVNNELTVRWSHPTNGSENALEDDDPIISEYVPTLSLGEEVILLETSRTYDPVFSNDVLNNSTLHQRVVFIPRFSGRLNNPDLTQVDDNDDGSTDSGNLQ